MRKTTFMVGFAAITLALTSCEGCVKKMAKGTVELGMSAIEGAAEAIDERGNRVAEKATDALGKVAEGVGKSLDRQLDEHADQVASVVGRTVVQTTAGFVDGFNDEVKQHYDEIKYTSNICSGVSLDYFAKHKAAAVVDAYFIILEKGMYASTFECTDNSGKVFMTKHIDIDKSMEPDRKYTLVSFALNQQEEEAFKDIKDVKVTVTKKK